MHAASTLICEFLITTIRGIKVIYRRGHSNDPEIIRSEEGVDALIDLLLASTEEQKAALVYSLQRPSLPSGYPDHEFCIGVNSELMVGAATFMGAAAGNLTSVGPFAGAATSSTFSLDIRESS